jgi:Spy/CpxP family protein refolding chaperone
MKTLKIGLSLAGCLLAMSLGTARVMAQGGGGAPPPDPLIPVYQKILEAERKSLSVTNDDEWGVISPRLLQVVQLKMQAHTIAVRLLFGSAFPRGGGVVGRGGRGGRAARVTPIETQALTGLVPVALEPEVDALIQRAMSDQTKMADVNATLARVRAARKKRQADMDKAQSALRAVLTHKQEMALVARGMLGMQTAAGMAGPSGGLMVDFGPALQRIMATNRMLLSVTADDEWKVISPRLLRVLQMKTDAYAVELNSLFLINGIRVITQLPAGRPDIGLDLGSRALTGELPVSLDPAERALENALDFHAPIADVNAAADNAAAAREQRQADLAKAQSDLLEVLTHKQEAVLVALGMLE